MAGEGSKRKRASTADKPTKRRRSSSGSEDNDDPNAKILLMEQGILESRKNYNDITVLLSTAKEDSEEAMLATVALCRIFVRLLAQGSLTFKKSLSEKEGVVVGWLRDQLSQYKVLLLEQMADEDLAVTALTLCMRVLKAEGEFLSNKEEYSFPTAFIGDIVAAVVESTNEDVRTAYIEEFADRNIKMVLYGMNEKVSNTFSILGLNELLKIGKDKGQAKEMIA